MHKTILAGLAILLAGAGLATAAPRSYELPEPTATLKPGPGSDTAQVCAACHSVDYIAFQPSQKGLAFWDAEVKKMIAVYRAPIDEADAKTIAAYLASTY